MVFLSEVFQKLLIVYILLERWFLNQLLLIQSPLIPTEEGFFITSVVVDYNLRKKYNNCYFCPTKMYLEFLILNICAIKYIYFN